jgi:PPOX class probable F420-dependent enzyme
MTTEREARLGMGVEPGPLSSAELAAFLARPLIARLGTVRPDGRPYVAPLWYQWDGSVFWIVARRGSAYVGHLRHDPRVCLSIASDELPYTRVTVIGTAQIANPDGSAGRWPAIARQMAHRYVGKADAGYADRTARFGRWLVQITPDEVITWRGGGWARRYTEDNA